MVRRSLLLAVAGFLAIDGAAHAGGSLAGGARVVAGAETAVVRRYRHLPWKAAANGRVPPGSEVHCEKACVLQVDADNTLMLTPSAVVAVGEYFYVPLVAGAASLVPAHQVELRDGTLEAVSPSERSIPLVVSVGPNEHIAFRGATVQITRLRDHTGVGAISGQARVGANRSWITVAKGQATVVRSEGRPTAPRPMLAAPKWVAGGGGCPAGVAVSDPERPAAVGGCWEPVPESRGYQVDFASDPEFRTPAASESVQGTSWSRSVGVGRYFVRVRSIDADGVFGEASPPRPLAALAYHLPPGGTANMEKRTVILPEGREISFGEPTGIELAIDKGGFSRAPKSLTMDGDTQHELRFRFREDPGSMSAVYTAKKRALRADVELTPRTPFWPSDRIDIAVTIRDPSGQLDPSKVDPKLKVMLGLTEVPVTWLRKGAVWSTRVHPRNMGGPTVVRVMADDEFGTPIGRNFIEIDYKTQGTRYF